VRSGPGDFGISPAKAPETPSSAVEFLILWNTATAAVELGALAPGLTGWLITQTTVVECVIRIGAGLLLAYPSLSQDVIGKILFGLAGPLP